MIYYSSRNSNITASPKKAIIQGLSGEGGLFVPKSSDIIKHKFDIKNLKNNNYIETAKYIFKIFFDDFSDEELNTCIKNAYNGTNFSSQLIAPTTSIGNDFLLELYHGPTSAFKDIALTILPQFMLCAYKNSFSKSNDEGPSNSKKIYILTATSGDTGKAALEGFKNIDNINISVFYPANGVSNIQKLQMQTTDGNNVSVYGINGSFDVCQKFVKELYVDANIKKICEENSTVLSSANSMNIGRLIPQVVYYIQSYIDLLKQGKINTDEKVNFIVPTGNFGNILAGYIAKQLGLPINKLICASNENDVLTKFINTGIYDRNRQLYTTIAPSIDILVSSNVERLLFWIFNGDYIKVNELCEKLQTEGIYNIANEYLQKIQNDFISYSSNEKEYKQAIKNAYNKYHRLIDTHTAVAYSCLNKYKNDNPNDKSKNIILSTASPYKFVKAVLSSIDETTNYDNTSEFECINILNEISKEPIPTNLQNIQNKKIRFNENFDIDKAKKIVIDNIKGNKNV